MTAESNPKQTLLLLALLGQGGAAMQKDLGAGLEKDRDALKRAGLIQVTKGRRGAIRLEVTDRDWDWASTHLDAPVPPRPTKLGNQVLQARLGQLQHYFQASGVPLAEILSQLVSEREPDPEPKARSKPRKPRTREPRAPEPTTPSFGPPAASYAQLRERVRAAYRGLTGGRFNDSIALSRLRAALPDLDAGTFEGVVKRMHDEDDGTTLMNLANPRDIEAERSSAIRIQGQDMHVLWISR
jgi:hypothetical protein